MIETIATLNYLMALGGIALALCAGVLVIDRYGSRQLAPYVKSWGILVALILTAGTSVMTLVYSEVFGFEPCGLCWLQRVFLYPMVFVLGVALYVRDRAVWRYIVSLAVPGAIVALYQHYLQMGGSEFVDCPAAGSSDCVTRFLFEFGFVTFPLISAVLFVFLIVLFWYSRDTERRSG